MLCSVVFEQAAIGRRGLTFLVFEGNAIQLVPDGTLLFHFALIIVMVAVLNATLLKPINRILQERERRTKGSLSEAQALILSVEEKASEYERRLREARGKGYRLLEQERGSAAGDRERRVKETKDEVLRWSTEERQRLKADESNVRSSLSIDVRERAREISGRILGRSI